MADFFRAKWSAAVQEEWVEALLRGREDLERASLQRVVELMNLAVPDALVTDYEDLEDALELPDPDDRHVLAAAIKARADLIVTANRRDFPPSTLARWFIEAQDPDAFLANQFHLDPARFLEVVKTVRARLQRRRKALRTIWRRCGDRDCSPPWRNLSPMTP